MFTTRPSSISVANTIANAGARLLQSRRLVRAPIWIYKARAGALLGSRVLMLEHIGRKSGAARYVVLEAFDHPTPDTFVVPSGFGEKSAMVPQPHGQPAGAGLHSQPRAGPCHCTGPRAAGSRPRARRLHPSTSARVGTVQVRDRDNPRQHNQ